MAGVTATKPPCKKDCGKVLDDLNRCVKCGRSFTQWLIDEQEADR